MRATAFLLTVLLLACDVQREDQEEQQEGPAVHTPIALTVEVFDTLDAGVYPVIAMPVWISQIRGGGYAVVDQSDKDIKIYDVSGAARGAAGGPGFGDGEFLQLISGGVFRDSTYGYDLSTRRLSIFSRTGEYQRALELPGPPEEPMPASVRTVDDSLLLVVGFTTGAESKHLVKLIRPDGSVRSTLFRMRGPYATGGATAELTQLTHVVADARDGVVYVGIYGSDSLFAFDYDGRQLAAGVITAIDGSPLPEFRRLLEQNGGELRLPDGRLVIDGAPTLTKIVAVDRWHALLEVTELALEGRADLDPTEGGVLLAAVRDPTGNLLRSEAHTLVARGLLGRDAGGSPLALRYIDDLGTRIEVSRVRIAAVRRSNEAM